MEQCLEMSGGGRADGAGIDVIKAVAAAEMLQASVIERRFHMPEFLESDGPYWISVGLFIDAERGRTTGIASIVQFADESLETSRFIIKQLIRLGVVEQYVDDAGEPAFRLNAAFAVQFSRYMTQQFSLVQRAYANGTATNPITRTIQLP